MIKQRNQVQAEGKRDNYLICTVRLNNSEPFTDTDLILESVRSKDRSSKNVGDGNKRLFTRVEYIHSFLKSSLSVF